MGKSELESSISTPVLPVSASQCPFHLQYMHSHSVFPTVDLLFT